MGEEQKDKTIVIIETVGKLLAVLLPAIADVVIKWQKHNITLDDLRALADMVKRPETYLRDEQ